MIPIRDINPTVIRPVVTLALIAINVLVFFAIQPQKSQVDADEFAYEYAAIPCELRSGDPLDIQEVRSGVCTDRITDILVPEAFPDKIVFLSVITSMFLHGGIAHLAFNMWSLWIFGDNVEEAFGKAGYLALYVVGGIVATVGYALFNSDSTIPLVGASGAIAAVMGAYLVLFPTHRILSLVFFFFVAVPAVLFIGIWFVGQFSIDPASNVAWEAHVAGFAFGVLVALLLRVPLLRRLEAHRTPRWASFP
ncbi:MAG: rhomboid family intramembrane serine protease [Acidimicrobiia bacterium]